MTIYDIPGIVRTAFPNAITTKNIISGFQIKGGYLFNRDIFSEIDFLRLYTTDRSDPDANVPTADSYISKQTNLNETTSPSISKEGDFPNLLLLSSEEVRPFEKPKPRKQRINRPRNRKFLLL